MTVRSQAFRESNLRMAFRRFVDARAGKQLTNNWLLPSLLWVLTLAGSGGQLLAGCHSLGEDWYHDYHHGHRAGSVWDLVNPSSNRLGDQWHSAQVFVFEDGEMRAISNPLPERCQGPQCQESPRHHNLDGWGVVEQQRTLTFGIHSIDRGLMQWPIPWSDWIGTAQLKKLAGFPPFLEEPPR